MRIFTDVIRKIRLSKTSSDYSLLPKVEKLRFFYFIMLFRRERIPFARVCAKRRLVRGRASRSRFYKGKNQMEIADEIGISQAQVSRLEKGAIDKLRKYMQ